MHRIDRCFEELARARRKALCAYLCIGDPSLEESEALALAAVEAGADLLELGVPFSDPTADGPTIARAAERAIASGATLTRVIEVASRLRARVEAPLVLFSYYNPILVTGEERVVALAAEAGIDALLVVDLPPEEAGPLRSLAASRGLGVVPLLAPTSDPARVEAVRRASAPPPGAPRGFVYAISMTGVTGANPSDLSSVSETAEALRSAFGLPVLLGFGIDSGESAKLAAGAPGAGADGVIVGTAIVKRIERGNTTEERASGVRALVSELRAALG
ncbi:tryptophan synthase subunit alpha [Polyangium aurulentum]|uniref:tryptophan synthase subunit alpha n=1 Tax=Polyangium aurulentum TaxID=2567896 RepID=UPI00146DC750|nr:tryptophan synthase subunit alpha [Polyangium aurulentum]UQA55210.1 tryptophan synthase subunit alpha [Polyangium aurulentum]